MKDLAKDENGSGALFMIAIVVILAIAIIIVPWVVGWAIAYLIHIITERPEIVSFWGRWIIGIAVIIVANVFKPDYACQMGRYIRGGNRDYWYNECER